MLKGFYGSSGIKVTSVLPDEMKSFLGEFAACELRSTLFIYKIKKKVIIKTSFNLRSGSIFVSLGETFRRDGRNEK